MADFDDIKTGSTQATTGPEPLPTDNPPEIIIIPPEEENLNKEE